MADFNSSYGNNLFKPTVFQTEFENPFAPKQTEKTLQEKIWEQEEIAKQHNIKIPGDKSKTTIFDILEAPRYAVTNVIHNLLERTGEVKSDGEIDNVLKSAVYGASLREKRNTSDLLKELFPGRSEAFYTIFGLAGDILTDPLTYATFGVAGGARGVKAVKAGMKAKNFVGTQSKRMAGAIAKDATGKLTTNAKKFIAKMGAETYQEAVQKQLIKKFGGKTWQEALARGQRKVYKEAGDYGLRFKLPFQKEGVKLASGTPADMLSGALSKFGVSNKITDPIANLPEVLAKSPTVIKLKKIFDTSAPFGVFKEGRTVQRAGEHLVNYRFDVAYDNVKTLNKGLKGVVKQAQTNPAIGKMLKNVQDKPVEKQTEWLLERLVRSIETGQAYKDTFPKALRGIRDEVDSIMKDVWGNLKRRGMVAKEQWVKGYFPRYFVNEATGEIGAFASKSEAYRTTAKFMKARSFPTRAEAEKAGFVLLNPLDSMEMYLKSAVRAITSHDTVESMVKKYGTKLGKLNTANVNTYKEGGTALVKVSKNLSYSMPAEAINKYKVKLKKPGKRYISLKSVGLENEYIMEKTLKDWGEKVQTVSDFDDTLFSKISVAGFEDWIAPKEIANVLNTVNEVMTNPAQATGLVKAFDKIQLLWKKQATIYNPGFHLRNLYSNVFMGFTKDGFDSNYLKNYKKAFDIMIRGARKDQGTVSIKLSKEVVEKTYDELYQLFKKEGISSGFWRGAEIDKGAHYAQRLHKTIARKIDDIGSGAGAVVENVTRVASTLNDLDKGIPLKESAQRVAQFFYDYGDLTASEKKIKRLIPFYTWIKKNMVQQLRLVVENPGRYTRFTSKPMRALDGFTEEEQKMLPEFMQGTYINPMGATTESGSKIAWNPFQPFQDLSKIDLNRPIKSAVDIAAGGITPLAKTPVELMLNKSQFLNKPIAYDTYSKQVAPISVAMFADKLPEEVKQRLDISVDADGRLTMPSKWVYAITSLIPLISKGSNVRTAITGEAPDYEKEQAPFKMLGSFGGLSVRPVDMDYYKEKYYTDRLRGLNQANNNFYRNLLNKGKSEGRIRRDTDLRELKTELRP